MKKIIQNSLWLVFDKIIKSLVGLFVGVWIARYFGPENFGKFSYANSLIILFSTIVPLGTEGILVREIVKNSERTNNLLYASFFLHLFSGIFLFSIACTILYILKYEDDLTFHIGLILAVPMLFRFLSVPRYFYEANTEIKYVVYIENFSFLVFSCIRVYLLIIKANLLYFMFSFLFESIVSYFSIFLFYIKGQIGIGRISVDLDLIKETLKESFPILIASLSIIIYMKIDQLMIGSMLGDTPIGIYSVAVRLSEFWYFIPMGLASSFFPTLITKKNQSQFDYLELLKVLHIVLISISFGMAIVIQFIGEDVIYWLYGTPYLGASNVLKVYIWSGIFVFIGVAGGNYYLIEGKHSYVLMKSLAGLIVNVVLNYIWIPIYGVWGAAFATLVSQLVASMFIPFFFRDVRELFFIQLSALSFWKWPSVLVSFVRRWQTGTL
ncbi:flippase [Leptospira sp. 2 VSF19]|uniref:Flippase n=1 Tax=Leptospira soteropolitanensis TaxID=2950025 RepID=A0AAW5VLC4_9LEPT|nr:flippase [Leptospira soteropolitanensis]MCW7493184.1 flippase [Leptospira soteropolitanensis]MCW7500747.1 flippase [Leptospira soteropolitanensis]MCW7523034.1 flippase [Leptospira soteropolitanensis]MCW7526859.1 flippase [Leptospira soteropolitanensis]MCW7530752.1 flippase [Leptospira soteropolitanensis]